MSWSRFFTWLGRSASDFQEQEFGDGEVHLLALPGALMAARIEDQFAAHDAFGGGLALGAADIGPAQHGADAFQ